jgi:hypothetical protein
MQALHGMGGTLGFECTGEIRFNLIAHRLAARVVIELNADPRQAVSLRTLGRYPYHATGEGDLLCLVQQAKQYEYFVTQGVVLFSRDKQAAVFDKRHVGLVEGGLVADRRREYALLHLGDWLGVVVTHEYALILQSLGAWLNRARETYPAKP